MLPNAGLFSIDHFLYGWQKIFTNKNIFPKDDQHVLFISFFSKMYNKKKSSSWLVLKFIIVIVLETLSKNFRFTQWKLSLWHSFEIHISLEWWLLSIFVNGIIINQHMWNKVISYSFRGFYAFQKVPMINYH